MILMSLCKLRLKLVRKKEKRRERKD